MHVQALIRFFSGLANGGGVSPLLFGLSLSLLWVLRCCRQNAGPNLVGLWFCRGFSFPTTTGGNGRFAVVGSSYGSHFFFPSSKCFFCRLHTQ